MTILVVGGTSRLAAPMIPLLAAGDRVRVLTRDRSRASHLADVECVVGDARDPAALDAAVAGCRVVISAMHGFVGPRGISPEAIDRDANVELVRAAKTAGVEHFVLVSGQGVRADHPMSLHRAKFAAETALRDSGLAFTIVRPTAFIETWRMVMEEMIATKGKALVFGPGRNPINFVSVRDVAALVALAVRDPALRGQCVEIGGPENLGFTTFAERLVAARETPVRIAHIPLPMLRAMAVLARPFAPAFARMSRAAVVMNTADMTFDARRLAGIPTTTLADVLATTARP